MITIDIDRLLEATAELKIDKKEFKMKKVEIDSLLENTRDYASTAFRGKMTKNTQFYS